MFWGGRHSNKFWQYYLPSTKGSLTLGSSDWSNRSKWSLPNGNHVQSTRQLWWGKGRLSQPTVRTHQATKFTAPKCLLSETLQQISAVAKLSITNYTWAMLWNIRRKRCWWKTKRNNLPSIIRLVTLLLQFNLFCSGTGWQHCKVIVKPGKNVFGRETYKAYLLFSNTLQGIHAFK